MGVIQIRNSPFIVIMLDESLDIATNKKLIIVHDNQVRLEFCANISIPDGTTGTLYNCIIKWLRDVGINLKKVNDIGTQSVITGRVSGVGVQIF
jgi:hypothetical protein